MKFTGKSIKYGDNVDTDVIIPARYLNTSDKKELASHCMEDIDKDFVNKVRVGDIMVAGYNFGCGSSREHAPIVIKESGISLVIARSFARIFYRNAINIGLAIVECPEAVDGISEGDMVEADLDNGSAQAVRRLNMLGNDILVRNGNWYVIGDIYWGSGGGYSGPSLLTDITAMENDVYVAVDKVRGRIFGYDDQGRLLYAFGGNGNMDGYFIRPSAIANMGHDLFILDEVDCSITLFTPTEFGQHIYNAIEYFQDGFYEESGNEWREVLKLNGNYDLAFIGIGRSLLQAEQYKEAMEYFELKWDRDNYSRAFKQYRKEWVEENIVLLFIGAFVVLVLPLIIGKIKSIKHEIDTADIFRDFSDKQ